MQRVKRRAAFHDSSGMSHAAPHFPDYPRIRTVRSFAELVATPFAAGVNALCWPRVLAGDFGEVVAQLGETGAGEGIVTIEDAQLASLAIRASAAGQMAIAVLREDLRQLREQDRDPVLNCIHDYPREEEPGPVRTDVFSFHADSAPVEADTWLCTYHGLPSEGLANEEALRRVDFPATRAALRTYLGADDADDADLRSPARALFRSALRDATGCAPFSFGVGHLWRIAVEWPGSAVPPCIHRAPDTVPGQPPRLLLIC